MMHQLNPNGYATSGAVCRLQLAASPASVCVFCAPLSQSVAKFGQIVDRLVRKAHMASDQSKTLGKIVHERIFMAWGRGAQIGLKLVKNSKSIIK